MSDYSNPDVSGIEPTVPLDSVDNGQPLLPPVEPTVVDPFGSGTAGYPDFSYQGMQDLAPTRDNLGISPDPLTKVGSYNPPPRPPEPTYIEPTYADPTPPVAPGLQYQQYPAPMMPPHPLPPYAYARLPEHPSTIPALVLSLAGLVLMIPFASPIAWYLAARGQRDTRLQPGRWRSSGMLTASLVLAIIGTLLWGLFTLLFIAAIITD